MKYLSKFIITKDKIIISALNRKLLRDLWHLRGQIIATALVVVCGVASFISMRTARDSLRESSGYNDSGRRR